MPALWKIPMILSVCMAASITYTPPTPPPDIREKSKFGTADFITRLTASSWGPLIGNVVPWTLGGLEVVGIRTGSPNLAVTPLFVLGWAMVVFGALLRRTCYRYLEAQFTFELALKRGHKLITSGPYRVVRHPSYTGFACVSLGMIITQACPGSWLAETGLMGRTTRIVVMAIWVTYVAVINGLVLSRVGTEDEVLRRQFSAEWVEWAKMTPYTLIPGVI
ncbi:hypothetical protein L226DRAFT_553880 [Lentinus tigrinus ALCF2SS1-7]|uniref:Protein-S-isoprenylcysteine O-methyltransferase n=1 Tax=Lentinus tigrinus ALCF2SS1-6 TaxID=1328759 RepID=A0A5C2RR48_9APHY|nr:hypothetical protein L227DRAFT_658545 [Lentinus tigrinus ALCF2SS1-6]RPD73207.1 hypothetical protein L226DRAFT_553880 [Lentinus tigrinus ALCF2SS1-7]